MRPISLRNNTIVHPWYSGHSTNIIAYGGKDRVKVSKKEFHTHIHLDQGKVEILSCIKIKIIIINEKYYKFYFQKKILQQKVYILT